MSNLSAEQTLKARILSATHDLLKEADWGLNVQICDELNSRPALVPSFIKYMKQRLDHKQQSVGTLALQLLSSVVDNCPKVRGAVADPEFLTFLVETLPKSIRQPLKKHIFGGRPVTNIEEIARCDKLLGLIRKWSNTFKSNEQLYTFNETFRKLSLDGVKFPLPQPGEEAPVITPDVNPDYQRAPSVASAPRGGARLEAEAIEEKGAEHIPISRSANAVADSHLPFPGANFTNKECRGAMEAIHMLKEILDVSDPSEDLRRNEVVQTLLAATVAPYKDRFTKRVTSGTCKSDAEMVEHIAAIDALVEIVAYYDGLVTGTRGRNRQSSNSRNTVQTAPQSTQPTYIPAPIFQPVTNVPISARGVEYDLRAPIGAVADPQTGIIPAAFPAATAASSPQSSSVTSSSSANSHQAFLNGSTSVPKHMPPPPYEKAQATKPAAVTADPLMDFLSQPNTQQQQHQQQPGLQLPSTSAQVPKPFDPVIPPPSAPAPGFSRIRSTSISTRTPITAAQQSQVQTQGKSSNVDDPLALLSSITISSNQSAQPSQQISSASSTDPFFALFPQGNQPQPNNAVNHQSATTNNRNNINTNASASNNTLSSADNDDPFFAIATGRL